MVIKKHKISILFIFILILTIIVYIFNPMVISIKDIEVNKYCIEQGYYGVYIKQEKSHNFKDYFCVVNKNDTYNEYDSLYIGYYKDFKRIKRGN